MIHHPGWLSVFGPALPNGGGVTIREGEKEIGMVIVSLYIAAQIISDVASLKIALIAGFSIDAGTFIYPLTFTIRDLVHKRLGKEAA